ncbi:MAG: DUF2975 domain-containing protein [Kiritimatiellia bacterium]
MKTDTQTPIERIRKASRVVRSACMIMMGITLTFFIAGVAGTIIRSETFCSLEYVSSNGQTKLPLSQLTTASIILMTVGVALVMAVRLKGLYHLYKLFGHYSEGDIFTAESVAQIRQLGITFLLGAGAQVLGVLIGWIIAWQCGIAPTVPIKFDPSSLIPFTGGDSGAIGSAVAGSVIILISWVMDTGRGLREESDLTI